MLGGWIALVTGESIGRINFIHLQALAVAVHLGQNRRCRNGRHLGIAFDNRFSRNLQLRQTVAVDQHQGRFEPQPLDRAAHGQQRCLQDVQLVDFFDAGLGNAAAQGPGADFIEKALAPFFSQDLGVRQPGNRLVDIEHHRSGNHRPGQRSAPGLVDADDQARPMPMGGLFVTQR